MPGEAWGGIAGVLSLAGVAEMDLQGCCNWHLGAAWAWPGQPWAGAGQRRVFSPLCQISSLASVRNNLDPTFGGVLGEGNRRHLKGRDRVTLQVLKESPPGWAQRETRGWGMKGEGDGGWLMGVGPDSSGADET